MIDMIIMLAYTFFIPKSLPEPGLDHTCATYNLITDSLHHAIRLGSFVL